MYSNDELIYPDKRTERGNRDDEEEETIDARELEEAERYNHSVENRLNDKREEDWRVHYQHKNKEPSRDQQIRVNNLPFLHTTTLLRSLLLTVIRLFKRSFLILWMTKALMPNIVTSMRS